MFHLITKIENKIAASPEKEKILTVTAPLPIVILERWPKVLPRSFIVLVWVWAILSSLSCRVRRNILPPTQGQPKVIQWIFACVSLMTSLRYVFVTTVISSIPRNYMDDSGWIITGLQLVRALSSAIEYNRVLDFNVTTITVNR